MCRKKTHYVTPSPAWPTSAAHKQLIMDRYKVAMAGKDCKHFAQGARSCPFGASCHYKHAYPDGSIEVSRCRAGGGGKQDSQAASVRTVGAAGATWHLRRLKPVTDGEQWAGKAAWSQFWRTGLHRPQAGPRRSLGATSSLASAKFPRGLVQVETEVPLSACFKCASCGHSMMASRT